MKRSLVSMLLLAALCGAGLGGCRQQPDGPVGAWPQFRGPTGMGVSAETDLPVRWRGDSRNVRWKSHVPGAGNSSPVVSGGRVFLTTTYKDLTDNQGAAGSHPEVHRVVLGYDFETGELLWKTPIFYGPVGERHWFTTHAAPTPVTDGEAVYVNFDAHLAALDFDGNILWKKDLDPRYLEFSHYGVATSPVLAGRALILMQDREEGESEDIGWIIAVDKKTGEEIWRDEWKHTCCSYTTPLVVRRGGKLELVNSTSVEVVAYDPETGEKLWRAEHTNTQPVPSMILEDDLLIVPGAIHNREIAAFRLEGTGKDTQVTQIWRTQVNVPEIASPVLYRGKLFAVTEGGILGAFNPENGHVIWRWRLEPGTYRNAILAGDGKVYVINDQGVTSIVDPDADKFRLIKRNKLGDGSNASPAIANGCLLIRGQQTLYCIEKKDEPGEAPGEQEGEPAADAQAD